MPLVSTMIYFLLAENYDALKETQQVGSIVIQSELNQQSMCFTLCTLWRDMEEKSQESMPLPRKDE